MEQPTTFGGAVQAAVSMSTVGTLTAVSAVIAHYPVYGGQAVRYGTAALILLFIARLRERAKTRPIAHRTRPTVREWLLFTALAATGLAGFNICVVEGTHYTNPATIGAVLGAIPIVFAIITPLMERRRPAPRLVTAAAIVTIGAVLANGSGGGSLPGLLLAVGALVGEVCFSLLAMPLLPRFGPIRVSAYSAAAAAPMLLVIGFIVDGTAVLRPPTPGEAAGLAYLTVVVTVAAFIMWYNALADIGADLANLFAGVIPLSAAVTAVVLGLRAPPPAELAGIALVTAGVAVGLGGSTSRRAAHVRHRRSSVLP